jgi:polysaccharide deacetylase 2 family uncharacterized protein YibQ
MARRRIGIGGKARIWAAVAALALGFGMVLEPLLPANPWRWVVAPSSTSAPGQVNRDPLAIGPEAVVPEAIAPPAQHKPVPVLEAAIPVPHRPPAIRTPPSAPSFVMPPLAPVPEGEAAWRRYAVAAGPEDGRPMIAIVIDDMGLDRHHSDEAVSLPAPLTLSFMTYAEDLPTQVGAARAHGHEIMLHVPMEPQAVRVDPGPNALRLGQDEDEIKRRLEWDLGRIDGIVGINNHMGSRFTESSEGMAPVLAMLRQRGLFFLDSRTTPHSVGIDLAVEIGLPHAARDIFLDVDLTDPAVAVELTRTEAVARRNGFAIAIGHPHDPTLTELRRWLPTAEGRGFRLVPVSAIVRHNETLAGHAQRDPPRE